MNRQKLADYAAIDSFSAIQEKYYYAINAIRLCEQDGATGFLHYDRKTLESWLYGICYDYGEIRYTPQKISLMTIQEITEALCSLVLASHQETVAICEQLWDMQQGIKREKV